MFMTLIQYWFWTGDDSYNEVTQQGMYWQKGHNDYFPHNYSQYLGNDDQVFWGLAAMTAAELNFPQQDGQPSWLTLAMGVYNSQIARWDTRSCAGGLTWQIWPYQAGYTIKNSISNGGLFQLAARLAYYTRNDTYAQWAEKIWDWSETTPLLNADTWTVEDTTSTGSNCTDHEDLQWSYNYGTYFNGAAYLYNYVWAAPFDGGRQRLTSTDRWPRKVEERHGWPSQYNLCSVLSRAVWREYYVRSGVRTGGNLQSQHVLFQGVLVDVAGFRNDPCVLYCERHRPEVAGVRSRGCGTMLRRGR